MAIAAAFKLLIILLALIGTCAFCRQQPFRQLSPALPIGKVDEDCNAPDPGECLHRATDKFSHPPGFSANIAIFKIDD
jgi:hypothetical protein